MNEPRLRFAPSPTGNVHIGNIRVAIFNWLYARHGSGSFLLRMEDTDRQRSTPEAIENLLQVMQWLKLDWDEEPMFQSQQLDNHLLAAAQLLANGYAYRHPRNDPGQAVFFRIPLDYQNIPGVSEVGTVELATAPGEPVVIDTTGICYALPSRKGKPVEQKSCLAGMRDLKVVDAEGNVLFDLEQQLSAILQEGTEFVIEQAAILKFTRHQVAFDDMVKGRLAKPLDSMRDLVIIRGDGTPVFHLANVCDDITQKITHIVRGDDHVENTYRHLFLFHTLGSQPPAYAHLPMIVNSQGKPYSKRDGDAFVGEFREKGYLPEALFNYLALLGWSPGDDREKLSRQPMTELFSLDRVQQTAAQFDIRKLDNLNGQYIAELSLENFILAARQQAAAYPWSSDIEPGLFTEVATLMQSRTKRLTDIADWQSFFVDIPEYDEKATLKQLKKSETREALADFAATIPNIADWSAASVETVIHSITEKHGIAQGKLNQPLRLAVTGTTIGAGIYETLALMGPELVGRRLAYALDKLGGE